jgi:hypothetical protein
MTFVTAIYNHNINTIYGGRGRDINFFDSSLRNIANLNMPIVIYASHEDAPGIEGRVSAYMKNFKVVPHDISGFEFCEAALEFKKKILHRISLNDRNETLCLSKAYWINDTIEKNYFPSDKYLWIDSGLTHHGIIPEKVGGVELMRRIPPAHYYPDNLNNIFTPILGEKLCNSVLQDKLFFCALPFQGDSMQFQHIMSEYCQKNLPVLTQHLIGGLFGGCKEPFQQFFQIYRDVLKYFLTKDVHFLEEQIFSTIYSVYPELFSLHKFYTWHFYVPGERCSMLDKDGDSFYKIFTRMNDLTLS